MIIDRILAVPALGGYYFDDLRSIKAGAKQDGFFYEGVPMTPGHDTVRQPGETISIILVLADGSFVFGDAVSIQYSGVVGRDPVLRAADYVDQVTGPLAAAFVGRDIRSWRSACAELEALRTADGQPLHTGVRYGMSQALLQASAWEMRELPAQMVAREFGCSVSRTEIPVLAQSGDDRYTGADKMIIKRIDAIPQGLFNSLEKVGVRGERLLEYVTWLAERVRSKGAADYRPTIHIDIYGMISSIAGEDIDECASYIGRLRDAAHPYPLRIEHPLETGDRDNLIDSMARLRLALRKRDIQVELCADDWCNTLEDIREFALAGAADMIQVKAPDLGSLSKSAEAVLMLKELGVKAFLGGTCNGTDQSSKMTVHIAMATNADLIYNKPGMGVDEGYMIVVNEMRRILALTA